MMSSVLCIEGLMSVSLVSVRSPWSLCDFYLSTGVFDASLCFFRAGKKGPSPIISNPSSAFAAAAVLAAAAAAAGHVVDIVFDLLHLFVISFCVGSHSVEKAARRHRTGLWAISSCMSLGTPYILALAALFAAAAVVACCSAAVGSVAFVISGGISFLSVCHHLSSPFCCCLIRFVVLQRCEVQASSPLYARREPLDLQSPSPIIEGPNGIHGPRDDVGR